MIAIYYILTSSFTFCYLILKYCLVLTYFNLFTHSFEHVYLKQNDNTF